MQRELADAAKGKGDASKQKWRIRITIQCDSHSVREKELAAFNKRYPKVNLYKGKLVNEIRIDFLLNDDISVKSIWHFGQSYSSRFLIALNIGTLGYFWWHLSADPDRYVTSIKNLIENVDLEAERIKGAIKVNWSDPKTNRMEVLSLSDLEQCLHCFIVLMGYQEEKLVDCYIRYSHAIALMAKSDIHLNQIHVAYGEMMKALQLLLLAYGTWDGKSSFLDTFVLAYGELFSGLYLDFNSILKFGVEYISGKSITVNQIPSAEQFMELKNMFDTIANLKINDDWKRDYLDKLGRDQP
jgi:hypothetical protein